MGYGGGRTLKDLKEYVVSMNGEKNSGSDDGKAEIQKVTLLDAKNFEESVKSGVSFVKFFAPWCGHCKRLAPTWEELARKYEGNSGVVIAHVDCAAADNTNRPLCDAQGVNGFPTLNIYKEGVKAEEYNGKRDLAELEKFVEKHLAAGSANEKDEL